MVWLGMKMTSQTSSSIGKALEQFSASMDLEMLCSVKQNVALMQTTVICLALHTPAEIPRSYGLLEPLNWKVLNFKDIPKTLMIY